MVVTVGVPDCPQKVVASNVFATTATISWEKPKSDGGSPVTGYMVERCTNNSDRWIRVNRDSVNQMTLDVDSLNEGSIYQYRVSAVNKKGESKPSEPCEPFTAKNPYGASVSKVTISLC